MAPSDETNVAKSLYTGHQHTGPSAVRYPCQGNGMGTEIQSEFTALEIGKGRIA
ncbi:hypothetical protein O9993_09925 [Vibrio lentus]|nr:hypothetical protein [Vibrio lentus]